MITISDGFKNSISKTEREMKGYVEIIYSQPNVGKGDDDLYDYPEILKINGVDLGVAEVSDNDRKGKNYASLEQDYFLLDGTFVLPNNDATKNQGIAYVSEYPFQNMNETYKRFYISPTYGLSSDKVCNGVTFYFQNNTPKRFKLSLEYVVDETTDPITLETIVKTEEDAEISDNGRILFKIDNLSIFRGYLEVQQVEYPNRRLRLQEVDFGLSGLYEGNELISFKTIEEIDIFNDSMPINELDVVLGDYSGKFDFKNEKGITKYLNNGVLLKPFVGIITEDNGIEYCPKGTYWLESYESNGKEATLKAKDIFSKLQDKDFNKSYEIVDGRLYHNPLPVQDYINFKSEKWGIPINDLHLSDCEINEVVDDTYSKVDTKITNLQKMAIVVGGTFNGNRYGEIDYKSLYNENATNTTDKYINISNMREYPNIEKKEPIRTISVEETTINYNEVGTLETFYTNSFTYYGDIWLYIDAEDWKTMEVPTLTNAILLTSSWSVDTTLPEGEQGYYGTIDDTYVFMKLRCNGDVSISIRGYSNSTTTNTNVKEVNNVGQDISISDDYVSSSGGSLKNISDNIINFNIQRRKKHKLSLQYNGDPTTECGDVIFVQNKYNNNLYDKIIITKIESEFKGSYNETIEGDILEN